VDNGDLTRNMIGYNKGY